MDKNLDLIAIGRSSVDLYGGQVGGRLEDMASFQKYIGGSPTNIAAGAARLGLRSALITRVGDEHLGRFIIEQLSREGVDTRKVITDPRRLTALAILGIRDDEDFPLIFYRENCADMALTEAEIDPAFIAEARCVCVTGTHLSHPKTEAAIVKALNIAQKIGAKTALDIDYRPTLWGLTGLGEAASRYVASEPVTRKLQSTLHLFDLIVGTEEEFHIAGGSADTIAALREVRSRTAAILVCKLGPMGAVAFQDEIPDSLEDGETGPGFNVEVFNVLGAGDGFMAGLLKGWLTGQDWRVSLSFANACGALAVSRHGCTPSYPSLHELEHFLREGVTTPALRNDKTLEHVHWATTRTPDIPELRVFAFDHRSQFEHLARQVGAPAGRISAFKEICLDAALTVANGRNGYGVLCDSQFGRRTLYRASGSGLWIGRPVEMPSSRPLRFDPEIGPDLGGIAEWPLEHAVKVLCVCHPGDAGPMWDAQRSALQRVFAAARRNRHEFLLEIIHPPSSQVSDTTLATMLEQIYAAGIYPDWWKLEPSKSDLAWHNTCRTIRSRDPYCRGVILLGLGSRPEELRTSFAAAAKYELVKGFAVGRTIFREIAESWLAGSIGDDNARGQLAQNFVALCAQWDNCRAQSGIGRD